MSIPADKSTDLSKLNSSEIPLQSESSSSDSSLQEVKSKRKKVIFVRNVDDHTSPASPLICSKEELTEAAKDVVGKPEENENFDENFYKNLVATRQHDATLRPPPDSQTIPQEEGVQHYHVRARRVNTEGKDHIEKVVVTQLKYCGSGVFSDVYEGFVVNKEDKNGTKQPCAIKKLWPDPAKEDRQISILRKFNHDNLLKLLYYYVCVHPRTKVCMWTLLIELMPSTVAIEQSNILRKFNHDNLLKLLYYYVCVHPRTKVSMWTLLIELMPSTVAIEQSKYILRGRIMPGIYSKLWMYQTLAGLAYLESKNFMHLDIKPDNLLVDKDTGRLKIGDFGSTREYTKGAEQNWAPELCFKFTKFGPTVDVWAAGCILVEMLTNRIVFFGNTNDEQLIRIFRILGTPSAEQIAQCIPSHDVDAGLLKKQYRPANWTRMLQRYNCRVSKSCTDLIGGILRYECKKRLRGAAALNHKYFATIKDPRAKLPNGALVPKLWRSSK
uniref:Protein kinase domain-containing protein n=1 Tax=Steinernema glaseri TaxID=37863 RepID=A0A1I7ZZT6_9BILA